jgi:hypothetical protein
MGGAQTGCEQCANPPLHCHLSAIKAGARASLDKVFGKLYAPAWL